MQTLLQYMRARDGLLYYGRTRETSAKIKLKYAAVGSRLRTSKYGLRA
jgi:hypothetical protein